MPYYYDFSYILFMLPALIVSIYAQIKVKSTFSKFSKVPSGNGLTGAQAAQMVLDMGGVEGVTIEHISGSLSDHFDPKSGVIRLSDDVFSKTSVAAVGVAAHEAGHAVQYARGYWPMKFRSALVPVTQFGSTLSMPLVFMGLFWPSMGVLATIGIVLFSAVVLFQLVTLPVELDASNRAMAALRESSVLGEEELLGAKKVLRAAGMTYLAATFAALMSLLRLVLMVSRRRD